MTPEAFPDRAKLVQALHAHFESLTDQTLTLSYMRIAAWDEVIRRGYTAADVALVVRWVKSQIGRQGSGYSRASLQFSRLIADADLFEDRLNLARAAFNQRPARPHVTQTTQQVGDTTRQVELPAEEEIVNLGETFANLRKSLMK